MIAAHTLPPGLLLRFDPARSCFSETVRLQAFSRALSQTSAAAPRASLGCRLRATAELFHVKQSLLLSGTPPLLRRGEPASAPIPAIAFGATEPIGIATTGLTAIADAPPRLGPFLFARAQWISCHSTVSVTTFATLTKHRSSSTLRRQVPVKDSRHWDNRPGSRLEPPPPWFYVLGHEQAREEC